MLLLLFFLKIASGKLNMVSVEALICSNNKMVYEDIGCLEKKSLRAWAPVVDNACFMKVLTNGPNISLW